VRFNHSWLGKKKKKVDNESKVEVEYEQKKRKKFFRRKKNFVQNAVEILLVEKE
jgi:hypothetical protein